MNRFTKPALVLFLEAFNRSFKSYFTQQELIIQDVQHVVGRPAPATSVRVGLSESMGTYTYSRLSLSQLYVRTSPYLPVGDMSDDAQVRTALEEYYQLRFTEDDGTLARAADPNDDMSWDVLLTPITDHLVWYEGLVLKLTPLNHIGRYIRYPLLVLESREPGSSGSVVDGGLW